MDEVRLLLDEVKLLENVQYGEKTERNEMLRKMRQCRVCILSETEEDNKSNAVKTSKPKMHTIFCRRDVLNGREA